jgi:hypothetical protein
MPRITMCMNDECDMRHECFRHLAMPNKYHQSYSWFRPNEDGFCEDKLELPSDSKLIKLNEQREDKK